MKDKNSALERTSIKITGRGASRLVTKRISSSLKLKRNSDFDGRLNIY